MCLSTEELFYTIVVPVIRMPLFLCGVQQEERKKDTAFGYGIHHYPFPFVISNDNKHNLMRQQMS